MVELIVRAVVIGSIYALLAMAFNTFGVEPEHER